MKRIVIILVAIFFATQFTNAQDKQLTLKDAIYYNSKTLPQSLRGFKWKHNSDQFTFIEDNKVIVGNAKNDKRKTLFEFDQLKESYIHEKSDTLKYFPQFKWVSDNTIFFKYANAYYSYNYKNNELKELCSHAAEVENVDIEDNTYALAYTKENNLYVSKDGKEYAVSNESDKGIISGKEVHRREFGINTGTFWSPKGNLLAFYRKDETMVTNYPIVDVSTRIAEVNPEKYPMAGMKSHHVTLGIHNINTKKTIFLKTGEPKEQYLTAVTWGPNEEYIYVALLNRDQNHLKLNKYNAQTGNLVKTLFEEKDEKYVEPERGLFFVKNNPNQFIWFSEKNGFDNLYLYSTEGELIRNLTNDKLIVTDLIGFSGNGEEVVFAAHPVNTIQRHIYSSELSTGEVKQLTKDQGTHIARLNDNGNYFVDIYSSHTQKIAREYNIFSLKGEKKQTILENQDPLKDYNLGETEIVNLEAEDGTPLFATLIKPSNFDEKKKYPAIVYVYGGPHAQLVTDSWLSGAGLFLNYMAQQGYVIFTVDNRGSANRGKAFEQAIHRNLGTVEVADQMKGVEYLKSLAYVDKNKIGVDGWSYGGFMTISLMLKHNDVFKVGCAGGPVIDWKYYEIMYGERYMGSPQNNPEGYENASLLNQVQNLKGKLLIIHGTADPVVVWQHSQAFLTKAIENGKQLDYFVYPGHKHNVRGLDRMHLYQKIQMYFDDYLKKGKTIVAASN